MENKDRSAFPAINNETAFYAPGLTKREYFAGLAMQGLLANYEAQKDMQGDPRYDGNNFSQVVAINSLEFADALLSELSKSQP